MQHAYTQHPPDTDGKADRQTDRQTDVLHTHIQYFNHSFKQHFKTKSSTLGRHLNKIFMLVNTKKKKKKKKHEIKIQNTMDIHCNEVSYFFHLICLQ